MTVVMRVLSAVVLCDNKTNYLCGPRLFVTALSFMGDSLAIVGLVWELVTCLVPAVGSAPLSLLVAHQSRLGWTQWSHRLCSVAPRSYSNYNG